MTTTRLSVASPPIILGWRGRLFHTSTHPLSAFPARLNCSLMHTCAYCGLLKMPNPLKFLLGALISEAYSWALRPWERSSACCPFIKATMGLTIEPCWKALIGARVLQLRVACLFFKQGYTPYFLTCVSWQCMPSCSVLDPIFDVLIIS